MKPNLIVLTNSFPNTSARSEDWLHDELKITHQFYNRITIVPEYFSHSFVELPLNCSVMDVTSASPLSLSPAEIVNCLRIVISDLISYPKKASFFKSFRYNLALVKQLHVKAKRIYHAQNDVEHNTIIYAYWADNLATTACIIKQKYMPCRVVTRGHGYEIFEDQTKYGVIPFRYFQNKYLTKLFADSKRGMNHLNKQNRKNPSVNSYSYVGTKDVSFPEFDTETVFSVLTCSHIRGVKRLLLMPNILKHIDFKLTWHVLGEGEELETLKQICLELPENITVIFHGYMKNDEIFEFYKNHFIHLFVSLSYSEGLPVSMMEAQSFGIPIMSTDVGGCSEICHDGTGFLVEKEFDPEEVAHKITEFKNSEKNTNIFREKCRVNWENNFNAQVNYTAFAKDITSL